MAASGHNPPFVKIYHSQAHDSSLRIPPQWVRLYGRDLPPQCFLVMPHGGKWDVRLLNVENGCYFRNGWYSFVVANNVINGDILVFTHVGAGVFQVIRAAALTGCPPIYDYDGALWPESETDLIPDLDTSDEYESSETDSIEIPLSFWTRFISESAIEGETYFTVCGGTWEMRLAKHRGRIRVKRGWSHFKQVNRLTVGMTCCFYLVDTEEVHFYVTIHP
ncbi:hypothetical protein SASPL_118557 [Salvia splendens]|uniref:TF-B3 domain-containing protein n=1 Tax=Salvia splendens TaxID=180675 RepID=A0A8X8ZZ83_SALSN|nr:hypothetical protein SASPL_118552 [Salvia splendens]KAG6421996.1 hypothetical protein SASPL_118557 [Salvia splendens]